jgi:hypothetical protein
MSSFSDKIEKMSKIGSKKGKKLFFLLEKLLSYGNNA